MAGNAKIDGALASAGALSISGNGEVDFEDDAIEDADFGGMCTNVQSSFNFQFGKASSGTVTFDKPFETGVTPIIFLMPTISTNNPDSTDGPASVFPANITNTGFTWSQEEPVSPASRYKASLSMSEVHWIAVTPGEHTLSDGTELVAKVINQNRAFGVNNSPYTNIPLDSDLDVFLHQKQTSINNCWLTTTSQFYNSGAQLAMEASEVRSGNRCRPGYINSLQNEKVGYLAIESGTGTFHFDGDEIIYQFGRNYRTAPGTGDLSYQCGSESSLTGFSNIPTLVSGKNSRRGGDGGWLRRCKLTNNRVSMVTDEDTYRDTDRRHVYEFYSFVALEKKEPELTCFNDGFNRQDLGSDWAIKTLGNSVAPAIVGQRMRITPASGNQATSSTYQRLFPAADNLVQVEFDYFAWSPSSGTGGDGVAIILSDSSITPQPGSFGGALGYAQRNDGTAGFAGGWIGVGIDEYGNFSSPNEGKVGGPGARSQSVSVRGSADASYMYLAGTGANLNPAIDVRSSNNAAPNHRYRISVDSREAGEALVLIERDVKDGNGFITLIPEFNARDIAGQGGVPEDFYLSITGSTGGANNNHELDNFQVCALLSEPVGQLVHHFEFDYSSSPLTCNAEDMTIRACSNAACDLFTDPVSATLFPASSANSSWIGGNIVNLTNGTATVSLKSNTVDPVTIGVTSSSPSTVAGSDTLCRKGSGALNTASCTLTFADSGFILAVPDEFSNKFSTDIIVKAVKKGDAGQQCVPGFQNQTKTLAFWSDYITPLTGTKKVSVKSAGVEEEVGGSFANSTPLALSFDVNGEASIDVNYADAGDMQLNTRYTGTGDESGLVMDGSDKFVRRPVGLCVESQSCINCDENSNVFKKAGEDFNLTVKAMAWQSDGDSDICSGNLITSNFKQAKINLTHDVIAPTLADGGVKGGLGLSEFEQIAGEQVIQQSVSEVGAFTFSASPEVGGYFGYSIPGATTETMGRFTPYYLTTTPVKPELLPSCTTFTYMDEPFAFESGLEPRLLVIGKNKAGGETKNYQIGNWWKYDNQWAGRVFSNLPSSTLPTLIDVSPTTSVVDFLGGVANGARSAYLKGAMLNYTRTSAPVVPFNALLELKLSSNDLKDSDGVCYQTSAVTNCAGVTFEEIAQGDDFELRYGRMVLENGYGPESESLRVPLRTEYVSAVSAGVATWVTNTDDSCSVYNTLTSVDTAETATMGLNMAFPVGFPAINAYTDPTLIQQVGTLGNGLDYIYFSVPNNSGVVPLKQHVEPWLKWYWNYEGNNPSGLYDPRASVYFGTYRGNDKVIYWREVN